MNQGSISEGSRAWEIAATALGLFSQKGYAGTSMLDIARAAKVGKSTLYSHYATKEALFRAATYIWTRTKIARLRDFIAAFDGPLVKLKALGDYVENAVDAPNQDAARMFVDFLGQSLIEGGALYNQSHYLMEEMRKAPQIIEEVLLDGVAQGVFKPQIAPAAGRLAINLISYIDGLIFRGVLLDREINAREQMTLYLEHLTATCLLTPEPVKTT